MDPAGRFTEAQKRVLADGFRRGSPLVCPLCGTPLDRRAVPPRNDVSYVRRRLWVTCATCHRSVVLDSRQPE